MSLTLHEAPELTWAPIRRLIPRRWTPYLRGLRKRVRRNSLQLEEPYRTVYPYTLSSPARQTSHPLATPSPSSSSRSS